MTDRKPGAPGQFKAIITLADLQKIQNGEEFTIILTRDDQPITEGTPYSKAAVLPDELAAVICPDILDPTPADALRSLVPVNGKKAMTGNLGMGGNRINDLAEPVNNTDAAPKSYVDNRTLIAEDPDGTGDVVLSYGVVLGESLPTAEGVGF